ncbi:hypothetical protein [Polycladomyces subterraneus]|uniref:Uncharacterized protein n=1 Tax=Polycladomyces subterraneus TaxID=1016997 RepID=A0ABT8IJS0_9BACL|nr:hypothetical protein [Polycladomyces subterraneus]MDN4593045.1 hypothetical protein [Polycladomyces subterraneus]
MKHHCHGLAVFAIANVLICLASSCIILLISRILAGLAAIAVTLFLF